MFYILDILECAAICSMSYLLQENPKYFFDIAGDNKQPRFHMGHCNGNFKISKTIDTTTIEVKVKSCTLSEAKDFILAMPVMLEAHYIFNFAYASSKTFGAMYFMQKYLLGIDDQTMSKQRINIIFEACQNQFNTMKHTNVDMN